MGNEPNKGRRDWIRRVATIPLLGSSARLFAANASPSSGAPRTLIVMLRGAYDAASLLVPVQSDFYYETRPSIAIRREQAIALKDGWGLHPAVAENLKPMVDRGQLAFVPFAGTHDTSRSHFETQDRIERGQGAPGEGASSKGGSPGQAGGADTGFLNRLASALQLRETAAFTARTPLIMRGAWPVPNIDLREKRKRRPQDENRAEAIERMYEGSALAERVRDGNAMRREMGSFNEMAESAQGAMETKGFERQARSIGRMMREQYRLGFIDLGGWDTHVAQGNTTGALAKRLGELSRGLAAYADEMGPAWRDTTVVVLSEFGRTLKENGNGGTDHGHGTVYWVLGGGLRGGSGGGSVLGEQVRVSASTLFENRDYPVLNEYRATLGGLFRRTHGLSDAQLQQVFPGVKARDIGLV